jgi:hypothetical protein
MFWGSVRKIGTDISDLVRASCWKSQCLSLPVDVGSSLCERTFLSDWLNIYCFTSLSRIFLFARCSWPLSREGSLLYHTFWDTRPRFSGLTRRTAPFSRLVRHARGCGRPVLTRILTGPYLSVLHRLPDVVSFLVHCSWIHSSTNITRRHRIIVKWLRMAIYNKQEKGGGTDKMEENWCSRLSHVQFKIPFSPKRTSIITSVISWLINMNKQCV